MTEETKYYPPEIEEFHVGFICEMESVRTFNGIEDVHDAGLKKKDVREAKSKWDSHRYEISEWGEVEWCENMSFPCHTDCNYRVKYLDREDIESLGWKPGVQGIPVDGYSGWEEFKKDSYRIVLSDSQGLVILNNNHTCFSGTIKNKSELINQLKRCGI